MGSARTRGKTLRCGSRGMSPAPPPPPACSIKGGRGRASSHLSLLLLLPLLSATVSAKDVFTNHFLVHLDPGHGHPDPPALARDIAKRNGFHSLGPLLNSPHEFHFVHAGLPHARHKRSLPHTRKLKTDPQVHHVFQQSGFKRVKRGFRGGEEMGIPREGPKKVKKKSSWSELRASLDHEDQIDPAVVHPEDLYQNLEEMVESKGKRGYDSLKVENLVTIPPPTDPSDPLFPYQWYLKNTGQNGGKVRLDLNVEAAWAQGVTGFNVTTAIMDDGVDYMHPDLINNYNAEASYDFSSNDPFPYPRYTDDWFNSHGTRCAGEVSAARDNEICGVGVAYNSMIAGIRMLDQPYMTDLIEANSMGHQPNLIDIYSASWGPTDDGRTVDGPRNATMRAIVRGVNEGRKGLGNIYVWASGDGGEDDDCNCDGYAASMWTISINSAINTGENAHYDESCSSTLASTFSNGAKDPNTGVATTDLYGKCTRTHSGTSAAAPEAAGVFALALEANPRLTWRDMQHLTVLTSKRNSLFDSKGRFHWTMNGVGLEFNHLFGFGVLDAGAMVALAKQWKTVPARFHCEAGSALGPARIPSRDKSLFLTIET